MDVFFIIVSIMLNILLLLAVVILYVRQNKLFGMEEMQKRTLKEMEELISAYLLEMKEENEQFINRVKEIDIRNNDQGISTIVLPKSNAKQNSAMKLEKKQDDSFSTRLGKTVNLHAVKAYEKQKIEQIAKENNMPTTIIDRTKISEEQEKEIQKRTNESVNVVNGESLIDQILTLKNKGLSEDEMAKKLNKGKTEISLLLKFQEKK